MKSSLSFSIPKPCPEKWDNFSLTSQGGFCTSCRKTVIDFRYMSNQEILDYFKIPRSHICGRFRSGQLTAYAEVSPVYVYPGLALVKAGLLSLLLLVIESQGSAQSAEPKSKTEYISYRGPRQEVTRDTTSDVLVGGIVISKEDKDPLPGVNIVRVGSIHGTITDKDGRFEFPEPLKPGDVLGFYFIGCQSMEYKIPRSAEVRVQIEMALHYEVMGEVAIQGPYISKRGLRAWFKKLF